MVVLMLTLALMSCERYARELQNNGTELAAYHHACRLAVEADVAGAYQLSTCVREADGGVECSWFVYGDRRLPFEPRTSF